MSVTYATRDSSSQVTLKSIDAHTLWTNPINVLSVPQHSPDLIIVEAISTQSTSSSSVLLVVLCLHLRKPLNVIKNSIQRSFLMIQIGGPDCLMMW